MPALVTHHRIITRGFGPKPSEAIDDGPNGVLGMRTLGSGPVPRGFGDFVKYLVETTRRIPRGRRPPHGKHDEYVERIMVAAKLVSAPWTDVDDLSETLTLDVPDVQGAVYAELDRRAQPRVAAHPVETDELTPENFKRAEQAVPTNPQMHVLAERVRKKHDT